MNRREFLKSISCAVVATVVTSSISLPTVLSITNTNQKLADIITIPIDRFNTLSITKFQYLSRWKAFNKKGYELTNGNTLIYRRFTGYE